ncbi:hypothetical protein Tco_0621723 [Tanacetum coccineum]
MSGCGELCVKTVMGIDAALEIPYSYRDEAGHRRVMQVLPCSLAYKAANQGEAGRKLDRPMTRSCKDPNNIAKKNDYEGSSGNTIGRKTRDCVGTSKCSRDNTSRNRVMPILKSSSALVGPFFPVVTGITASSNRSDSSKTPTGLFLRGHWQQR